MMEKKQTKKSNNSKKETLKNSKKDKSVETGSSLKNSPSNKSASQLSISHFSSVSTPEYREGWNRIWGGDKPTPNIIKTNDYINFPIEFSLSTQDISDVTKTKLLKELQVYANRNGLNLPESKDLILDNIDFFCKIIVKNYLFFYI